MQAIDIKNLNFSYGNILVFKNLNLSVSEGSFVTILGRNGSGKTTLANILAGSLKYKGNILIFNKPFNIDNIGFVNEQLENDNNDTVMNILIKEMPDLNKDNIKKKIFNISVKFHFSNYLDKSFNTLSVIEKKLIILGSYLIKPVKILIIDNFFEDFDKDLKKEILNKLRRFAKKENMTIVNFTNDVEDSLIADNIVIIGNGKILLNGSKRVVLENEEFFENYELGLPFVVSLSNKLRFYDLLDKIYFDEKKLVDKLWK